MARGCKVQGQDDGGIKTESTRQGVGELRRESLQWKMVEARALGPFPS